MGGVEDEREREIRAREGGREGGREGEGYQRKREVGRRDEGEIRWG